MQVNRIIQWCAAVATVASATCSIAAECLAPKVIFVNGVLNTRAETQAGQVELRKALIEGGAPADLSVGSVYNPTDPSLGDLFEVAQDYQLTQGHLGFVNAILTAASLVPPLTGVASFLSTWLGQQVSSTAPTIRNINVELAIRDAILHEIRDNKRPVVVVAHSQGNMYVNNAVRGLKSMESSINGIRSIGVVGIGVASTIDLGSSFQPDLYRYVTRADDLIIVPLSGSLPSNMTSMDVGGGQDASGTGHQLIEDYLTGQITGVYGGVRQTPRNVVKKAFNEVYAAVSKAWPCGTLSTELVLNLPAPPTKALARALDASGAPGSGSISVQDSAGHAVGAAVPLGADGKATLPFDYNTTGTYTLKWVREGQEVTSSQIYAIAIQSSAKEWFTNTGTYIYGFGSIPAVWIINGTGSQIDILGLHPLFYSVNYLNYPTSPSGGADNLATIEQYVFDQSGTRPVGYGRLVNASYPGPGVNLTSYSCRKIPDGAGLLQVIDFVAVGYGPVGAQLYSDAQLKLSSCGMWTSVPSASSPSACRRDAGQPARLDVMGSATGSASTWQYVRIGLSGYNSYLPDGSCH